MKANEIFKEEDIGRKSMQPARVAMKGRDLRHPRIRVTNSYFIVHNSIMEMEKIFLGIYS